MEYSIYKVHFYQYHPSLKIYQTATLLLKQTVPPTMHRGTLNTLLSFQPTLYAYQSTTFCVCRNDVVGVVGSECNNEQQQSTTTINHNNNNNNQTIMNTDCTETFASLTNIDGDLAHDNGAPSGMKPSKKSRVSWPKMRTVKTDATGRNKYLYPFLDDKTNQKDTRLVVLLLEIAPYEAKRGIKLVAWNTFLKTLQDEVDEDGDFLFPSISKNALKSRFDGYISFVKLHRQVSKGNMGFDEESPSALLAKLYELEAKYESSKAAEEDERKHVGDKLADREEGKELCLFGSGEIEVLKNRKSKATGLDFEDDIDDEYVEVIDLNKKKSYGTKKSRLSKTQNVYESMDATAAALERRAENKKKTMENLSNVKQQEIAVRQTEADNGRIEAEARLQEANNQRFDAETRRKETESTQQFMLSMMERFGQVIERLSEGKK
jgi:hypothetical protein